jgi:hypothetical protein
VFSLDNADSVLPDDGALGLLVEQLTKVVVGRARRLKKSKLVVRLVTFRYDLKLHLGGLLVQEGCPTATGFALSRKSMLLELLTSASSIIMIKGARSIVSGAVMLRKGNRTLCS